MKCKRLITLIKDWYIHVQGEAMAPARMVEFMNKHIATCEECQQDPDVRQEVEKIREIVLPPSKIPKVRGAADSDGEDEEPEESDETDNTPEDEDEGETVEDDDDEDDDDITDSD
jgi:hypothetical protein